MELVNVIGNTTNTKCMDTGTHEIHLVTTFLQYAF